MATRAVAFGWVMACATCGSVAADQPAGADFAGRSASAPARAAVDWIVGRGDARDQPFAVVDKRSAQLFVFDSHGRLVGAASALLGLAKGDSSAPGVGQRAASFIAPQERTTPAGRFDAEPGHNLQREAIVWVDYAAAVAIHRLRPAPAAQRRPDRLASTAADERRITLGCIVVDPAFYDTVVAPTLGSRRGVVYVLPDSGDWRGWFERPRQDASL